MSNLLYVTSSLMSEASTSSRISAELVGTMKAGRPDLRVTERHLRPETIPHLSQDLLTGLSTAADKRSAAQQQAVELADRLIAEVEAADTIVVATPMYNFSVPSTLKAWIDHIARVGRTVRYTANGPQGLLRDKKVYVVVSRGGYYAGEGVARALDFQEPYLRAFFAFVGLTDVTFIHVEGQGISPEAAAKGLEAARAQSGAVFAAAA